MSKTYKKVGNFLEVKEGKTKDETTLYTFLSLHGQRERLLQELEEVDELIAEATRLGVS